MWADFLSHFQDEAADAALYEAEVGDHVPIQENQSEENNPPHDEAGGSGGTPKDELEENESEKRKDFVATAEVSETIVWYVYLRTDEN